MTWHTSGDSEPRWFYMALDAERWELRRVEVHIDGRRERFTKAEFDASGIDEYPTPSLDEPHAADDLAARIMTAAEFELDWERSSASWPGRAHPSN